MRWAYIGGVCDPQYGWCARSKDLEPIGLAFMDLRSANPIFPSSLPYTCSLAGPPLHVLREVLMYVIWKLPHYISVCCLSELLSVNCGSYCRILRERLDSMAIVLLKSSRTICALNCGGWWLETARVSSGFVQC